MVCQNHATEVRIHAIKYSAEITVPCRIQRHPHRLFGPVISCVSHSTAPEQIASTDQSGQKDIHSIGGDDNSIESEPASVGSCPIRASLIINGYSHAFGESGGIIIVGSL